MATVIPSRVRKRRAQQLEQERESAQLKRFLEQFTIERSIIPGIGAGRKAVLQTYNVESAWDITDHNVSRVPDFGPVFTGKFKGRRQSVECKFRYDPTKGVDRRDIEALDREIIDLRRNLELALLAGPTELTKIRIEILTQRNSLLGSVNEAYKALVQAEVDMRAAGA